MKDASTTSSSDLDATTVVAYLREHTAVEVDGSPRVTVLRGGVSHRVFAIEGGPDPLVVKQALPRLATVAHWEANTDRVASEAAGLRALGEVLPDAVPTVLHLDASRGVIVIRHAPPRFEDWRSRLLRGEVEPRVAEWLGTALGEWQRHTRQPAELAPRLHDRGVFEQLRIEAFYEVLRKGSPLADAIDEAIVDLRRSTDCLVHGDYSPKNVLVGPERPTGWIIDLEAAHVGSKAYDAAFLCSHLVLKAVHLADRRADLLEAAARFVAAYELATGPVAADPGLMARHLGCLLAARVDGRSPAPYLTPEERDQVRELAARALTPPRDHVQDVLDLAAVAR